jgi:hypothetical protein
MDKIAKIFFLLFLITVSCSKKKIYDENLNNIILVVRKNISIDFKNDKLYLEHEGLKYEDTIVFTTSEKGKIINLFNEYDLGNRNGQFWYIDENSTTADLHDEIIVLNMNKIKSHYTVNEYHDFDNQVFENNENKIVKFRNLLKSIIEQKSSCIDPLNNRTQL